MKDASRSSFSDFFLIDIGLFRILIGSCCFFENQIYRQDETKKSKAKTFNRKIPTDFRISNFLFRPTTWRDWFLEFGFLRFAYEI